VKQISSNQIKQKALELGFHKVGIATVDDAAMFVEAQRLQAWLALGYQADMAWMANPKRQNIDSVMPSVRSLICVALNYYTPHQRPQVVNMLKFLVMVGDATITKFCTKN
jgi:epoxyqueuosine reductase